MNELQKTQLEILTSFIKVCDDNNLTYYLIGGTALGAIRHKGFIPWDDDTDVAMPRKDYDKLMKMQNQFPAHYFIQTYETDSHYIYNFAKIRDSRTTYIEHNFKQHRINHGVWIDVFPLDGVSKKVKPSKNFRYRMYYVWWNVFMTFLPGLLRKPKKGTIWKDIVFNIVGGLFYIFNIAHLRNRWVDFLLRRHKYEDCVLIANCTGNIPKRAAMPKAFFGEGVKVSFENIKAVVPTDYDGYLKWVYGDYMKFPPEDKRVGHHYHSGYSLTQGYKDYMKENKIQELANASFYFNVD